MQNEVGDRAFRQIVVTVVRWQSPVLLRMMLRIGCGGGQKRQAGSNSLNAILSTCSHALHDSGALHEVRKQQRGSKRDGQHDREANRVLAGTMRLVTAWHGDKLPRCGCGADDAVQHRTTLGRPP